MGSLPSPATRRSPENSLESKAYKIAENFSQFIPVPNDRSRLGFLLYKYLSGEGDKPPALLKSSKIKIIGISLEELAEKISKELETIKK